MPKSIGKGSSNRMRDGLSWQMTAACRVDIRIPPVLIQVIFGNRKSCSRIKQNCELATKLDKNLNKTTCEVHVGGEHPSGAENFERVLN